MGYPSVNPTEEPDVVETTLVPTMLPTENPTVDVIVDDGNINDDTTNDVDNGDNRDGVDAPAKSEGLDAVVDDLGIYLYIGVGAVALVLLALIGVLVFCCLKRKKMGKAVTNMGYDDW